MCSQTQFEPAVPARSKTECEKQVTEPGAWELGRGGTSSTLTDRWDSLKPGACLRAAKTRCTGYILHNSRFCLYSLSL